MDYELLQVDIFAHILRYLQVSELKKCYCTFDS